MITLEAVPGEEAPGTIFMKKRGSKDESVA